MCADARHQPPPAPRLGPRAAPFPLDALPFLELPAPVMDFPKASRPKTMSGDESAPPSPPRAPRLRPVPCPVFDELMPELVLPEVGVAEGEFLKAGYDTENGAWSDCNNSDGELDLGNDFLVFGRLWVSEMSTAIGDDLSSCPSPVSSCPNGDVSPELDIHTTESVKFGANVTALQVVEAFNSQPRTIPMGGYFMLPEAAVTSTC